MVEYPIIVYEQRKWTVYVHVNKVNGKKYVGITSQNVKSRWLSNGNGYKKCTVFYRAIQKYGWDNFKHYIIHTRLTMSEACCLEQIYIKALQSKIAENGYNKADGGVGTCGMQPSNYIDLTGRQIGHLKVLYRNGTRITDSGIRRTIWHCKCECGREIDVPYSDLAYGNTTSCGCVHYENMRQCKHNKYDIFDDHVILYVDENKFKIDIDDFEKIFDYTWKIDQHGRYKYNLLSTKEIDGTRYTYRIINMILGIPYNNHFSPAVIFNNGDQYDLSKENICVQVPTSANYDEYMKYVYMGGMKHLYFSKGRWEIQKIDGTHKSFDKLDDAIQYCKKYGEYTKPRKTMPIICLNSLEIFNGGAPQAVQYTNVKRSSINHCCNGRNHYAGQNPYTGENLKWMKLSDYNMLSQDTKDELKYKYYTGSNLRREECV